MDIYNILGVVCSLSLLALSLALGVWLLKQKCNLNASAGLVETSDGERAEQIKGAENARRRLSYPKGARRTTEIHGVNELGYLRHTDGSYTRGYHLQASALCMPTMRK